MSVHFKLMEPAVSCAVTTVYFNIICSDVVLCLVA